MATDERNHATEENRNDGCENPFCADGDGEIKTPEGWMCPECAGVLGDSE